MKPKFTILATLACLSPYANASDFNQLELDEAIARSLEEANEESSLQEAIQFSLQSYEAEEKKIQSEKDGAFAKLLAQQQEMEFSQTEQDEILALKLHNELNKNSAINFPALQKMMTCSDRNSLSEVINNFKKITHDMDVHKMISIFAKENYPKIHQLEMDYLNFTNNRPVLAFGEIKQNIANFLANLEKTDLHDKASVFHRKESIIKVLGLIENYYKNPIDGETGVDLTKIFSDTYQMAQFYGDEYLKILCVKLAENLETNGGCHPGVTGRLIQFYSKMVMDALEHA